MSNSMNTNSDLMVYQTDSGALEVRFDATHDTVWLSQAQMAELFESSTDNISLHLKNIYLEQELSEQATTEDYSVVRQEGTRQVKRNLKHYNLDAIISVGYRVSSKRAVLFRQWATRTLREHLTQGFTVNQARLAQNVKTFEAALALVQKAAASPELSSDMGRGLVDVLARYAQTFLLLQQYDEGLLDEPAAQSVSGTLHFPGRGGVTNVGLRLRAEFAATVGCQYDPGNHDCPAGCPDSVGDLVCLPV